MTSLFPPLQIKMTTMKHFELPFVTFAMKSGKLYKAFIDT